MRRVIEVDVEVAHYLPLHEDMCEVNGRKQSASTLEHMVLRALNVDLHNSLAERQDVDKVVQHDGVNDDWTDSAAFWHLHQQLY